MKLTISIAPDLHRRLKVAAAERRQQMSQIIAGLIEGDLAGYVHCPPHALRASHRITLNLTPSVFAEIEGRLVENGQGFALQTDAMGTKVANMDGICVVGTYDL
jgi:hypothetical protein